MYVYLSLRTTRLKGRISNFTVSFISIIIYILSLSLSLHLFSHSLQKLKLRWGKGLEYQVFQGLKYLGKPTELLIFIAIPNLFLSISVSTYLVLGFLMKPVFMKLGQRHVLTPVFSKAASSSVKALWNTTAANLLELKINSSRESSQDHSGKLLHLFNCDVCFP